MTIYAWILLGYLALSLPLIPFKVGQERTKGQAAESLIATVAVIVFLVLHLFAGY